MKNQLTLALFFSAWMMISAACVPVTPMPNTAPTDTATEEAASDQLSLTGVTWQWFSLSDPLAETTVPMPENYTLTFQEDGTVSVKADCNNAGGSYEVDESTLSITIGPMTMAACPPDSLSDQFVQNLGFAANYFFADGQLFIDMMADGGTLAFMPAAAAAATNSSSDMADVIEATFVCPDGTNIDAVFDNAADTVTITLPDGTLTLPRVFSGSGVRYSNETTTFWNKGNEVLVEVDGETLYQQCVAEEAAATSEITDVMWQLVEIQYMNDTVETPADPTQYKLMLAADGSFTAQIDCNQGQGNYEMAGASLTFGEIATTRAMCPPESLADAYQQGLTDATSYVMEDGDLFIAFGPDAGILHLTPAASE